MYETRGTLKWIGEVQTFPSGFSKREFVVTTEHDKYPQDLKFEIVKDKIAMLDAFSTGSPVVVNFDIRGNEYNGKYFVNLSCWKLQAADGSAPAAGGPPARGGAVAGAGAGAAGPPVADFRNEDDFDDDEVPF